MVLFSPRSVSRAALVQGAATWWLGMMAVSARVDGIPGYAPSAGTLTGGLALPKVGFETLLPSVEKIATDDDALAKTLRAAERLEGWEATLPDKLVRMERARTLSAYCAILGDEAYTGVALKKALLDAEAAAGEAAAGEGAEAERALRAAEQLSSAADAARQLSALLPEVVVQQVRDYNAKIAGAGS